MTFSSILSSSHVAQHLGRQLVTQWTKGGITLLVTILVSGPGGGLPCEKVGDTHRLDWRCKSRILISRHYFSRQGVF